MFGTLTLRWQTPPLVPNSLFTVNKPELGRFHCDWSWAAELDRSSAGHFRCYGAAPTIGQLANLKRLFFESTTLVIASLKKSVSSESSDQQHTVKRLPIAEKRARAEEQATRLSGLTFEGAKPQFGGLGQHYA